MKCKTCDCEHESIFVHCKECGVLISCDLVIKGRCFRCEIKRLNSDLKNMTDLLRRVRAFADPRAPENRDLDSPWPDVREFLKRTP